MKIEIFEDLKVWKSSRVLVKTIYGLTSTRLFSKDYGLKDQIQRASVSIMTNIAEGFERDNNKEFIRFLLYSKGSAGEVRSLLYVAKDLEYISEEKFTKTFELALDIIKQLANFIKYLKDVKTNSRS